jgi:hypothetical protein
MSSQYRKIKYKEEGPYGSTVDRYLYIWSHDTVDVVNIFDDKGNHMFSFSEGTEFDMGKALVVALTDWKHEKMEKMTREEIKLASW